MRSRGAGGGQARAALSAAERDHDEDHLESFEQDALERDRERVPVQSGALSSRAAPRPARAPRGRPRPRRAAPCSRSSAGSPCAATADRTRAAARRRRGEASRSGSTLSAGPERSHENGQDDQGRADADQRRAPAAHDADAEHDRQRLDHLDGAGEEGAGEDEDRPGAHEDVLPGLGTTSPLGARRRSSAESPSRST